MIQHNPHFISITVREHVTWYGKYCTGFKF